jgi:hypothetical protein
LRTVEHSALEKIAARDVAGFYAVARALVE